MGIDGASSQGSRVPGFQGSRVPRFQRSRVPRFECSRVPRFQRSRVPRFQCSGVPRFQRSRVPQEHTSPVGIDRKCPGDVVRRSCGRPQPGRDERVHAPRRNLLFDARRAIAFDRNRPAGAAARQRVAAVISQMEVEPVGHDRDSPRNSMQRGDSPCNGRDCPRHDPVTKPKAGSGIEPYHRASSLRVRTRAVRACFGAVGLTLDGWRGIT